MREWIEMAKDSVDEHVEKLLRENPILSNEGFKERFPEIVGVAAFIYGGYVTSQRNTGRFKLFDKLGIGEIGEYLELLKTGDEEAVKAYTSTRNILGFGQKGTD
jgi:hypothetical protein